MIDDRGAVVRVVKNCINIIKEKTAADAAMTEAARQAQMLNLMLVNVMMCDLDTYLETSLKFRS